MSEHLLRAIAQVLRMEATRFIAGTDESETFLDAADSLLEVVDLLEALDG